MKARLFETLGLLIVAPLPFWGQSQPPALPVVTGCAQSGSSPSSVALTVSGAGLAPDSTLEWNGSSIASAVIGGTQIAASVPSGAGSPLDGAVVSVLSGGVVANCVTAVVTAPLLLASVSPAGIDATAGSFNIAVAGSGFVPGSAVTWANTKLSTAFVSSSQLTAAVPAGLAGLSGVYNLAVVNPNGTASNAVSINVQPVLTAITPNAVALGQSGTAITATGLGFVSTDVLTLNLPNGPLKLATAYVSSTTLTAVVPPSALTLAFQAGVAVSDTSAILSSRVSPLTIGQPPSIAALNPGSAVAGGADFTVVVTGTGYTPAAVVQWNGVGSSTTFVSATQLTASVRANEIAVPLTGSITVSVPNGLSNTVAFPVAPPPPSTAAGGVVNAASAVASIAPGSLISVFGSNLAAGAATPDSYPAPTSLSGVTVIIDGQKSPLLFVNPSQINAQVPFETPVGEATLVVTVAGQQSSPASFNVSATAPGVFVDQQTNHAVAQNYPDYSVNSSANPAAPGQYVIVYLTGQGAIDMPVPTGAPAPSNQAVNALAAGQATIAGQPATVQFLGLAPGLVGVAQMNLLVPDVPPGDQTLEISIGGVAAKSSLISIKSK